MYAKQNFKVKKKNKQAGLSCSQLRFNLVPAQADLIKRGI